MRALVFALTLLLLSAFSCVRSFRGVSSSKISSTEEMYASSDGFAVMKIESATSLGLKAEIKNKSKEAFDVDLSLATQTVRWTEKPVTPEVSWFDGCELDEEKRCRSTIFRLPPGQTKKVSWSYDVHDYGKFSLPVLKESRVIDNFAIMFEICPLFSECRPASSSR